MKKLFLILIAFFSVSAFSQDPFDRKQREQTEYPKEGLTLPPVSACVYSEPRLAEERPYFNHSGQKSAWHSHSRKNTGRYSNRRYM